MHEVPPISPSAKNGETPLTGVQLLSKTLGSKPKGLSGIRPKCNVCLWTYHSDGTQMRPCRTEMEGVSGHSDRRFGKPPHLPPCVSGKEQSRFGKVESNLTNFKC